MDILKQRAKILKSIRNWFCDNYALEVFTPSISQFANTDPSLDSFIIKGLTFKGYLNTSPEFYIKQLLAEYQQDCYQISRVYRDGEIGRNHQPEFDMLEWYRLNRDEFQLMKEVEDLINKILKKHHPVKKADYYSYTELFEKNFKISPQQLNLEKCIAICEAQLLHYPKVWQQKKDLNAFLDLILSQLITTNFKTDRLTFIYHYPKKQASLAKCKITQEGVIAQRFECYWGAMELANGFNELQDPDEQLNRFELDNQKRIELGKDVLPIDTNLISALKKGLPQCSGVAIGIERLHMVYTSAKHISQVCFFSAKEN